MVFVITRREFLLLNAAFGAGAFAPAIFGSLLVQRFTMEEYRTLIAVARTLFPHDRVDDSVYQEAVDAIEARCCANAQIFSTVRSGIAALENASGGPFADMSAQARVALLKSMEGGSFFQLVYKETLDTLYGSPAVWGSLLMLSAPRVSQ